MNYQYEDLARVHMWARRQEARQLQRGHNLERVHRLQRKVDRARAQARLLLARAL
jgi:hypothetical protein